MTLFGALTSHQHPIGPSGVPSVKRGGVRKALTVMKSNTIFMFLVVALLAMMGTQRTNAQELRLLGTDNCYNSDKVITVGTGTVSWNKATSTITLKNITNEATVNPLGLLIDCMDIPKLKIVLEGRNYIHSSSYFLKWQNGDVEISGEGSLIVNTLFLYAIKYNGGTNATLTIKDCTLDLKADYGGINGDSNLNLLINNAIVKTVGSKQISGIHYLNSLKLRNCSILTPNVKYFSPSDNRKGYFYEVGVVGIYSDELLIGPKPAMMFVTEDEKGEAESLAWEYAGTPVILGAYAKGGLAPNNSCISNLVVSQRTVDIIGDVSYMQLLNFGPIIWLTFSPSIVLEEFYCEGQKLTHLDVSMLSNLKVLFIVKNQITGAKTTALMRSLPDRTGRETGKLFIQRDHDVQNTWTDEDVKIANDKNWKLYNQSGGGRFATDTEITRGTTGIASPTADMPAKKHGVYSLQGVRLGDSLDRLPAGIYIVDGQKVVKK